MGPLVRLSLFAAPVLVASLGLKLAVLPAPAEPGGDPFADQVTAFLRDKGFEEIRRVGDAMVVARKAGCEVLVASISPDGWQRDALARLAPEGARIVLEPGTAPASSPWAGMASRLWNRIMPLSGRPKTPVPRRAVIDSAECLPSETWASFLATPPSHY